MPLSEAPPPPRKAALLRVPFVRRCEMAFDNGVSGSGFLVNINLRGVYIAYDDMPTLGQSVKVRFSVPDRDTELALEGAVVWLNPRQQHPVHSLPPGFGLQFRSLTPEDAAIIERVISEYQDRQHPMP